MSDNGNDKKTVVSLFKSNWASILTIFAMVATVINFYWKANDFITEIVNIEIEKQINAHAKHAQAERDSIINEITFKYFKPLEINIEMHQFFINKIVQGLHAEFDPIIHNNVKLFKSNPNTSGKSQHWYIFERDGKWEMYKAIYNPTHDCYEYYDIIKKKKIFIGR